MSPDDPRQHLRVVHWPARMSGRAAGRATVGDRRLTCYQVASMVWDGRSIDEIADELDITAEEVRMACWWLLREVNEAAPWGESPWALAATRAWRSASAPSWRSWAGRWRAWATGEIDHPGDPVNRHTVTEDVWS